MSTKMKPMPSGGVPKTLGSQILTPNVGIRPRIRRRIPNSIPASKKTATTPSSGRRPSASKLPSEVERKAQPQHTNSTSGTKTKTTQVETKEETQDEQDVTFIDVPNKLSSSKLLRLGNDEEHRIDPKEILEQSQESLYDRVYEIELHASHITVMESLERFTKLRVLDLSCNFIEKIVNLDNNTDLRELKLYDNDLEQIENLDKLRELQNLQLQHNKIKCVGKGLHNVRKLRVLRLDSNCLCRLEVRELASCDQLTCLDISNNKLDSISAVSCLPNLEELYAVNNRLRTLTDMSRCKKLQEIDISYNRLTDLSGLKGLHNLTSLHVSNNQVTSLNTVGKLKKIQELNMQKNKLTSLKQILELFPTIQILDISENHIESWPQVLFLRNLQELAELYISGNPFSLAYGEHANYHTDLQQLLPSLDILDGAHMKKLSCRPGTPLMRPMSASAVITSRQVESQLRSLDDEMSVFEASLASRFESLRATMAHLPTEVPSRPGTAVQSDNRPVSRSAKRSRIKMAQEFAAQQYDSVNTSAPDHFTKDDKKTH